MKVAVQPTGRAGGSDSTGSGAGAGGLGEESAPAGGSVPGRGSVGTAISSGSGFFSAGFATDRRFWRERLPIKCSRLAAVNPEVTPGQVGMMWLKTTLAKEK